MARYLVTGATGFIGQHLIHALARAGNGVVTLDRRPLPDGAMDAASRVFVGNVTDRRLLAEAMRECDGIFHLADVTSGPFHGEVLSRSQETNVTGAVLLLEAAARAGGMPMVYASSAAVYGAGGDRPCRETDAPQPVSAYGTGKTCLELYARAAGRTYGVRSYGLRIFNAYGPGRHRRAGVAGVIPIFVEAAKAGRDLMIQGDGGQVRDFVHIDDVIRCFVAAMERTDNSGPLANVCTGRAISIRELAGLVVALAGSRSAIVETEGRSEEIGRLVGDPEHAAKALGVRAGTALERGIEDLLKDPAAE